MTREDLVMRLREHLVRIHGEASAAGTAEELAALADRFVPAGSGERDRELFDERDVLVIAYGDHVTSPGEAPLATLRRFLADHLVGAVNALHLLPHYPATSDDGFAVSDYALVDPALGDWDDVERLADDVDLMLDAVVNHTSASHPWFRGWLAGDPRYAGFYREVDPAADLGAVVRPRTTPLLTPFQGADGRERQVWTTFSADQVDLDYRNPAVLVAATGVLLDYVAHGARMLRLDAIAFLWKEIGRPSIHEPRTHEVIRLWRTLLDAVAPGTLLVTETNVPHRENVSYLGEGSDEAHLVYQFALPPLTLDAFRGGDARRLAGWAGALRTPSPQTTFLNFLASHDGIGVRPVEGLLPDERVDELARAVVANGGHVSYRATAGGPRPYELNSVYLDALTDPGEHDRRRTVDRFVAAHSVLLALAGVPAFYLHSLLGSRNWAQGVELTGRPRTVNREKLDLAALEAELASPESLRRVVLDRLRARILTRTSEPAFHPAAPQHVVPAGADRLVVQRTRLPVAGREGASVLCVHDVSGRPGRYRGRAPDGLPPGTRLVDLCDGSEHETEADGTVDVDLPAYGVRWLRAG